MGLGQPFIEHEGVNRTFRVDCEQGFALKMTGDFPHVIVSRGKLWRTGGIGINRQQIL